MRSHLALRELAISLAEQGQHVVRFDFRGTGDSDLDLNEIQMADWVDDIVAVADETASLTAATHVSLVGIRASAPLVCQAAIRLPKCKLLVLWDPILDGADYVDQLRASQRLLLHKNRKMTGRDRADVATEFAGHKLNPGMVAELSSMSLASCRNASHLSLKIVSTLSDFALPDCHAEVASVRYDCSWGGDSEAIMMPQPVLERLSQCLR
jgi:pimeloyl-ACP methyl ester carboxylesterase